MLRSGTKINTVSNANCRNMFTDSSGSILCVNDLMRYKAEEMKISSYYYFFLLGQLSVSDL